MTAPKWGGPWVGKVAAHGHWETPATITLELAQVPESVTVSGNESFAGSLGSVTQTNGFLSSADGVSSWDTSYGTLIASGTFGPVPGDAVGQVVSSSRIHLTCSLYSRWAADQSHPQTVHVVMDSGMLINQASPYAGSVDGDPGGWQVEETAAQMFNVYLQPLFQGGQTNGTYELHAEITAISMTLVYQPPDVWVSD